MGVADSRRSCRRWPIVSPPMAPLARFSGPTPRAISSIFSGELRLQASDFRQGEEREPPAASVSNRRPSFRTWKHQVCSLKPSSRCQLEDGAGTIWLDAGRPNAGRWRRPFRSPTALSPARWPPRPESARTGRRTRSVVGGQTTDRKMNDRPLGHRGGQQGTCPAGWVFARCTIALSRQRQLGGQSPQPKSQREHFLSRLATPARHRRAFGAGDGQ